MASSNDDDDGEIWGTPDDDVVFAADEGYGNYRLPRQDDYFEYERPEPQWGRIIEFVPSVDDEPIAQPAAVVPAAVVPAAVVPAAVVPAAEAPSAHLISEPDENPNDDSDDSDEVSDEVSEEDPPDEVSDEVSDEDHEHSDDLETEEVIAERKHLFEKLMANIERSPYLSDEDANQLLKLMEGAVKVINSQEVKYRVLTTCLRELSKIPMRKHYAEQGEERNIAASEFGEEGTSGQH